MERGNDVGLRIGPRFVNMNHDTPLLLPPNPRDWVPSDHLRHFLLDAVDVAMECGSPLPLWSPQRRWDPLRGGAEKL
jgi:hypothetical protein